RILAQGRDSGLAVDALAMIGSVEKSTELSQALRDLTGKVAELRALRGRYTDANVAVRRVSDEVAVLEQQTIPALATKLTQEMAVQEAGLAQRVDSAAGGLRRDRTDRRVHYPEHVTGTMGLAILGAVPHLERGRNGKKAGAVLQVVEAVRGIRLNVLHAHGAGPAVLTVTSPGRSDGKSFVASNLALAFADAGYRTLLVDGDVRCGTLHRALKLARKPGLVDVLGGKASTELVV